MVIYKLIIVCSERSVILIRGTVNRPGERVTAEKEKLTRVRSGGNYALKPDEALVEKAEHVTVKGGGKLVFGSLSARFKLWHHSWPLACLSRLPSIHV